MRSVIGQTVELPAPAETLFDMYLDPAEHGAITGAQVTIVKEAGAAFGAFDGALNGTLLAVVRPVLIVQSWRSTNFKRADPDSPLILSFRTKNDAGQISLVHVDVPDHDHDGVTERWPTYYWTPWREYLLRQAR